MKTSRKILFTLMLLVSILAVCITTITLDNTALTIAANSSNQVVEESQSNEPIKTSYATTVSNDLWTNHWSTFTGNGTEQMPYKISLGSQLAYVAYQIRTNSKHAYVTAHFQLVSDINLGNYYWYPIKNFKGTFDGNNHIISNLTINNKTVNYGTGIEQFGLFGSIDGGTVKNLAIINADISITLGTSAHGGSIGILSGWVNGDSKVEISKVSTDGVIDVSSSAEVCHVGGVFGHFGAQKNYPRECYDIKSNATINLFDCSNRLDVGGIAGTLDKANQNTVGNSPATLQRCIFTGTITGSYGNDNLNAGGIVGSLIHGTTKKHVVKECFYDIYKLNNIENGTEVVLNSAFKAIGYINSSLTNTDIDTDVVKGLKTSEIVASTTYSSTTFDFINMWEFEPPIAEVERPLYPRLRGFNYPIAIYHKLSFYIPYNNVTKDTFPFIGTEDLLWTIKYIEHGHGLAELPQLPAISGYQAKWEMTDENGDRININQIEGPHKIYAIYISPEDQCLITISAVEFINNVPTTIGNYNVQIVQSKGQKIAYLSIPQITGYTFVNWYTDRNCTNLLNFDTTILNFSQIDVIARMERVSFTVTFRENLEGVESVVKEETVVYNYTATEFTPEEKYGYMFGGFYASIGWNGIEYYYYNQFTFTTPITSNRTVYLKWDKVSFGVTFIANGKHIDHNGDETTEPLAVQYKNLIPEDGIPTIPALLGHDKTPPFWSLDGTTAADFTTFKVVEDVTFTAVYTLNEYTVTFMYPDSIMSNTGMIGVEQIIETQQVKHGENASEPDRTNLAQIPSFRFNGWDRTLYDVQSDRIIYATYLRTAVNLIFRSFDGSQVVVSDIAFGSSFVIDPDINDDCPKPRTREGYTQNKPYWNMESFTTNSSSDEAWYDVETKTLYNITTDVTISAKYQINKYIVKYILPDGSEVKYEVEHEGSIGAIPSVSTGLFEKVVYSKHIDKVTQDEIITVKVESFALTVYVIAGAILGAGVILLTIKLSKRKKISSVNNTSLNRLR